MNGRTVEAALLGQQSRILIIGDPEKALFDWQGLEVYADVAQGVKAASEIEYQAVAVVVSGMRYRLREVLKALRSGCRSRIVLLTHIYEEPIARSLMAGPLSGPPLIDDYLLCPTGARGLVAWAVGPGPDRVDDRLPGPDATVEARWQERIRQLERLATEDDLTGLKNRRYIWEFARQILDYARREDQRVTLMFYDIDDFKHYNDEYGHTAGDRILKEAAVLMRSCCRAHDVVGRIGGDEFAVIFWDDPVLKDAPDQPERRSAHVDHPREAIVIARRFRKALEASDLALLGPGGKGVLTISGGLASYPQDGDNVEQLFEKADAALLEAKRSGKNRVYLVGSPQNDIGQED